MRADWLSSEESLQRGAVNGTLVEGPYMVAEF